MMKFSSTWITTVMYERFIAKHKLIQRSERLEAQVTYPLGQHYQDEYNSIDNLIIQGISYAETAENFIWPAIQQARRSIDAWILLKKKALGLKVSSRLIQRSMKKTTIDFHLRHMG